MHQLLEKTIEINSKIEDLVDEFEWDKILDLSQKRDGYIKEYFDLSPLPDDNSVVSKVIVDMTKSDEKISNLIDNKKSELIAKSLSLKNNQHAINQYKFNQTG
jgi:hypothetical protein